MALVKLKDGLYVNPDHIISMSGDNTKAKIVTTEVTNYGQTVSVSQTHNLDMDVDKVAELLHSAERAKSWGNRASS